MSYTITLSDPPVRRVPEVLSALGEVRCVEYPDGLPDGEWPAGIVHLFREGASTRGVEVTRNDDLAVRLVALACPADWDLAFALLRAFAGDPAAEVHGEDGTAGAVADLEQAFDEVAARETAGGIAGIDAVLERSAAEVALSGPVRDVFLGPRSLGELPADATARVEALFELIREVQFLERQGYDYRTPVPLSAPGVPSFAVWSPDRAEAFAPVEALGVSTPGGNVYVPVDELPALLGDRFRWLDDRQFAISPTPQGDLPDLLARARAAGTDPYEATRKRWWQFWRA